MNVKLHPFGPGSEILDQHHVYSAESDGRCAVCELMEHRPTRPPCNHVHVRYGACTLLYDHACAHRWVNDHRRFWIAGAVWFGLALLIAGLWLWGKLWTF